MDSKVIVNMVTSGHP
ncbi:hypothetical protein A2U01_0092930, partial [Trifolium medium]|nr:hypothetical protein [Trifolium medium]